MRIHGLNARFWEWVNDGWVKLTLRPGQSLTHYRFGRGDEGWWSELNRWTHEFDRVLNEWKTEGRDCDGRLTRIGALVCEMGELDGLGHSRDPHWQGAEHFFRGAPIRRPKWKKSKAECVFDEYAQAAGY